MYNSILKIRALPMVAALVAGAVIAAPTAAAAPEHTAPTGCISDRSDADLAALADPTGMTTFEHAHARIAGLRAEFADSGDYRETFLLAFDEILELTGPTLSGDVYADPVWAEDLTVEIVRLYLQNFHAHLTGGDVAPHWAEAFALAEHCDRSPGRVLMGQIVAHLVVDFAEALAAIGTTTNDTRDFYSFGDALVAATPNITAAFEQTYGIDLEPVFTGWVAGEIFGDTETTTVMFQSGRSVAFVNNFGLQNPTTIDVVRTEMDLAVEAASIALDGLEAAGTI